MNLAEFEEIQSQFKDVPDTEIFRIDESLEVNNAYLSSSDFRPNIHVTGNASFRNTTLEELPRGFTVSGGLYLRYSTLTVFPEDVVVGHNLEVSFTNIQHLPKLAINGSLTAAGSKLRTLSDETKIKRDLYLSRTPLATLPKNLKVGGHLYIDETQITSLPACLEAHTLSFDKSTPLIRLEDLPKVQHFNNSSPVFVASLETLQKCSNPEIAFIFPEEPCSKDFLQLLRRPTLSTESLVFVSNQLEKFLSNSPQEDSDLSLQLLELFSSSQDAELRETLRNCIFLCSKAPDRKRSTRV